MRAAAFVPMQPPRMGALQIHATGPALDRAACTQAADMAAASVVPQTGKFRTHLISFQVPYRAAAVSEVTDFALNRGVAGTCSISDKWSITTINTAILLVPLRFMHLQLSDLFVS
jgi:hypothetical protein